MAVCANCGAQTARTRTIFTISGARDECPNCAPQKFEAIKDPSTQKIWIGPEYNPNAYEKRYDEDGAYYVAKPEFTAEQEAKVAQPATDEREAQQRAENRKRMTRRTEPMTPAEMRAAMVKASQYAEMLRESVEREAAAAKEAELQSWIQKAGNA